MKRVVTLAAIVLLALALLAGGRPAISEAATTHTIAVFGDPQEADAKLTTPDLSPGFQFIVPFLAQTGADAAIGLGDYARVENFTQKQTDERYNTFLYEYGKTNIAFSNTVWVQGNHDAVSTMDRTEWATYFKQPADLHAWGPYQIDGIYVIQLQSWAPGYDAYIGYYGEGDSRNSPQANWLVATLQSLPRDAWVVVADHIPVADTAVNTSPEAEAESPLLLALFAKYGVDLVLGGHDHDYRRHMGPNGVPYITDGMAGGPPVATNFVPIDPHDLVVFSGLAATPSDDHFGYLTIQFDGATMHVTAYEGQLDVPPMQASMQAFDSFPVSNQESSVPTVSGFVPTSGAVASSVTLTGSGFSGASKVTFNGVSAAFTVNSDTQITATVPSGATSGKIAVTTPGGTATATTSFTVISAPTISSFSPASAAVGATVTLTGTNFTGASKVTFNGVAASFTVKSATQITATVPVGQSSGKIAVTTPGGTATSSANFIATGWYVQKSGATVYLYAVTFANTTDGWAVGDGILATTNGGATWTVQNDADLYAVACANASDAWAVGALGNLLATTNGGATWSAQSSGAVADTDLNGVACANASDAWAVGDGGTIIATTNGGATWTQQSSPTSKPLLGVACANVSDAWAVGQGGVILVTTNGGATWTQQTSPTSYNLQGVAFANVNDGWAVGYDSTTNASVILTTTNGGTSWTQQAAFAGDDLNAVHFVSASAGWVVGGNASGGLALVTSNGGTTWTQQNSGPTGSPLAGVAFANSSDGWAVSDNGDILATSDGGYLAPTLSSFSPTSAAVGATVTLTGTNFTGASKVTFNGVSATFTVSSATKITVTVPNGLSSGPIAVTTPGGTATSAASFIATGWHAQKSGTTADFMGVSFPSVSQGWAVTDAGTILATTNGGATWKAQTSGTTEALDGVRFANTSDGWAVGGAGTILATTNGGTTWKVQSSGTTAGLGGVACANASDVWTVGYAGTTSTILATTNGGTTWKVQSSVAGEQLDAIAFANASDGWAVGFNASGNDYILATTNGGATWTQQSPGTTDVLTGLACANASHAWAVGEGGSIIATTNGGTTWKVQSSGATGGPLWGIAFANASVGWAVGYTPTVGGTILTTSNGGATWSAQSSGTTGSLQTAACANASDVWAVGGAGVILATTDGGYLAPTLTSFTPTSGATGTTVTLTGTNFNGASKVTFNGVSATFTVKSATQITATVPSTASTGKIAVTTSGGTATSAASFTVKPMITSFSPTSGAVGTSVTLAGSGFAGATKVTFNGTSAKFTVVSATKITTTVPSGATSGKIVVTTPAGTATSTTSFTV